MEKLSAELGIPSDLLKTVALMLLSIPLALGFRCLHSPHLRYLYSLVIGLAYLVYLLEQWAAYVLAAALVPYLLCLAVGRYQYQISLVTSTGFLMFIHTYRFLYDYMGWKIDCSVSVMYLVTKVVYYGHYHSLHARTTSLFHYLAYCFYFPSVLIGPSFNYPTFQAFIEKKDGYQRTPIKADLFAKEIGKTLIFSVATGLLMPIFTPYWALTNSWYLSLPPLAKFLTLNIIGVFYRIKFYSAWGYAQLAVDISGLSWNQKQQDYSSVRCGSPRFETEINPRNKTAYWNTSIQIWLKEMIFDKVVSMTKSTGVATFVTFLTSALWHGVHLTYYIGFIQWAIIIIISKWAYRLSQARPDLSSSPFAKALAFLISSSLLNYTGMFIVVLTWNEAVQCYRNMDFIGNLIMFALLIASFVVTPRMIGGKPRHKHNLTGEGKEKEKEKEKEDEGKSGKQKGHQQ